MHGGQQLRLFNAYYDDYGFQPIVVFDAEGRFVTALLRPGKRPSGVEIRGFVRRLVGALRIHCELILERRPHPEQGFRACLGIVPPIDRAARSPPAT